MLNVSALESTIGGGIPYLSNGHNSYYSNKFQRAFESIGSSLSNQGSKELDIKDQIYPKSEPSIDGKEYEAQTDSNFNVEDNQRRVIQVQEGNDSDRFRQQFWSEMFKKHDIQRQQKIQLQSDLQSKLFDKNNENIQQNSGQHIVQNEEQIKTNPIEIPVVTTPTALFVINAPNYDNKDNVWNINNHKQEQHHQQSQQQYAEIDNKSRQELNKDYQKSRIYPQSPVLAKPKIQTIEAKCSKDTIHVRITYDRPFDGLIYTKDHYNDKMCHFVKPRSGQMKFEFALELNHCGTTLQDSPKGETILENTIIFQNEPVFQEIWDSVRHLRCAWSGVFDKTVQTSINVEVHDMQTITYRGDSVESVMDVQYGHGLHAEPVQGFVRIGDDLTLLVSLIGSDANNFDIRVKDCIAHNGDVKNSVQLTDENGCVVKKKLLGNFQKERNADESTVTAFSYMQAFRFPEKTEVYFECNIEICKYECQNSCPELGDVLIRSQSQQIDESVKSRAKRSINGKHKNETQVEPIRLLRGIRVVVPNDVDYIDPQNLSAVSKNEYLLQRVSMHSTYFRANWA
ncbi:uncharacterized protein LOC128962478 [Oppia nitens]|uniref:uncharacterized protein LOC128962478 n=1 Tax=Oppia nitens TaxID=1686743 RepID=UPI0023D9E6D2|nr:uncharacterized protein LOC128962478 [Oppia nitens]